MTETQGYKISYKTARVALSALRAHERLVLSWLELEPMEDRLREHFRNDLADIRAAIAELRVM